MLLLFLLETISSKSINNWELGGVVHVTFRFFTEESLEHKQLLVLLFCEPLLGVHGGAKGGEFWFN